MSRTVRYVHHKSPVSALVIVGAAAGVLFTTWLQKPSAPIMPAQSAIAAPIAPAALTADQITAAVKAALPAPAAPAAAPAVKTVVKTVVKRVRVKAPAAPRIVFAVPHYHVCSCSL